MLEIDISVFCSYMAWWITIDSSCIVYHGWQIEYHFLCFIYYSYYIPVYVETALIKVFCHSTYSHALYMDIGVTVHDEIAMLFGGVEKK